MDYTTVLVSMVHRVVSSNSIKITWCQSHVHCNLLLHLHCEGFRSFPSNSPSTLIRRSIPYSPLAQIYPKFHNWMLLTSCRTIENKENGLEFMSPAEQSFIYIVLSWNRSRPVVDPGFPRRLLTQHLITVQGWGPNVPENVGKWRKRDREVGCAFEIYVDLHRRRRSFMISRLRSIAISGFTFGFAQFACILRKVTTWK